MGKTKIDWADRTWNPVTGCLRGCKYCYANKIAKRFCRKSDEHGNQYDFENIKGNHELGMPLLQIVNTKQGEKITKSPYPYGFNPTFHKYKLDEPQKMKTSQNIFVCSMADLFGEWVPNEWIKSVFKACEAASQHRYMFLTKNPYKYLESYDKQILLINKNMWFGATVTNTFALQSIDADVFDLFLLKHKKQANVFLSLEPLMSEIKDVGLINMTKFDWIIIGAETGNRKDKIVPKRKWIENIVNACKNANVPVFLKSSLADIWGEPLIQEYPF